MKDGVTTLRIDLGVSAQQIAQQVMINNKLIEEQIVKGIELALSDLTEEDNFVELIREGTKREIQDIIRISVSSWEFRNKISKAIEEQMGKKISEYANSVASKVLEEL